MISKNITPVQDGPWKPLWIGKAEIAESGFLDCIFGLRATGVVRLTPSHILFQSTAFGIKIPLREIRYAACNEGAIHIRTTGSVFYRGQGRYALEPLSDTESLYQQILRLCFGGWIGS